MISSPRVRDSLSLVADQTTAAEKEFKLTPAMQSARDAGLKALKPSAKELEHGLKLHAESIVFDAYGFAPRSALDVEALRKAVRGRRVGRRVAGPCAKRWG